MGWRRTEARVVTKLRNFLGYRMRVSEWIGLAMVLGAPYLVVGFIWSLAHTEHLHDMHGVNLVVSFLGAIVSWPVLLFSNVCMT
jgi:hypothetical protein